MTLTTESALAVAVCAPLLMGYVCRAGKSSWWTVRPLPLLFHLFGACTVLASMYQAAATGALGLGWFAVGMAGVWLPWSYPTWADGVPEHAQTAPAPLQVMEGRRG